MSTPETANAKAVKFIVGVDYHSTERANNLFITEGDYGVLGEVCHVGDAAHYATESDALDRAKRYAKSIREEDGDIKATLTVLALSVQSTGSVVTTR